MPTREQVARLENARRLFIQAARELDQACNGAYADGSNMEPNDMIACALSHPETFDLMVKLR